MDARWQVFIALCTCMLRMLICWTNFLHVLENAERTSGPIFFSTVTTTTETYQAGDVVKFHEALSNVNPGYGGWDPVTNQFKCSLDGYYLFMVTLYKSSSSAYNHQARLRSSTNTQIANINNYRSDSGSTYSTFSSTMHAIILCQQDELGWVEMVSTGTINSFHHYNQFSGLLLLEGPV